MHVGRNRRQTESQKINLKIVLFTERKNSMFVMENEV